MKFIGLCGEMVTKMGKQHLVIYREIQQPRQIWLWALILLTAGIFWYGVIQQIYFRVPFGSNPAPDVILIILWFIFGVFFPVVAFWFFKLIIEVREDGVYIRFIPFHFQYRKFLFQNLTDYERIAYSVLDFGGWGIRMNMNGETAYNLNGKHGIKLNLHTKTVIIGTQNPEELEKAIEFSRDSSTL